MTADHTGGRYRTPSALLAALDSRLKIEAADREIDINRLRRQVAFERLLVRLAGEDDPANSAWVLKGGLALELRLENKCRSTRDLDLALTELVTDAREIHDRLIDELAEDRAGDHFSFSAAAPQLLTADQAGRPGWRFPIEVRLGGKTFVKVRLDVVARAEEIAGSVEQVTFRSALAFAGYPPSITVAAIDLSQHAAEKLHALTADYGDRPNTRVKDLADMVLLIEQGLVQAGGVADRLRTVFSVRAGHEPPVDLPAPPSAWSKDFPSVVAGLDVETRSIEAAYALVNSFWKACARSNEQR